MEEHAIAKEPAQKVNRDSAPRSSRNKKLFIVSGALLLMVIMAICFWLAKQKPEQKPENSNTEAREDESKASANEVVLKPEQLTAAGIATVVVKKDAVSELIKVTGTVEANQQQTQEITPLISGRIDQVNVTLGDRVRAGQILAVISSPTIAEKHGKLHEAETRLSLAERNLERIQKPENRVAVVSAKAKLEESEAALRRTQRLTELGAGAGKDLIAAEANYKTAKAEYDFQSNISLNREVLQAQAELETARVEVSHIRNELRSLGAVVPEGEGSRNNHDISVVALSAPISGTITERKVNAGAGIEAGNPLFAITNLSNVWVIANAPEAQVGRLIVGTSAEIRATSLGEEALTGRITYIDSTLNEETRTARVRIEVTNPGEKLKVGAFVEVGFQSAGIQSNPLPESELLVPSEALQHIGNRTIVFIPKTGETGHFEAREVALGQAVNGFYRINNGLAEGEQVVTKGSFTLKTQLMKGLLGEE